MKTHVIDLNPKLNNDELNELFVASWPGHQRRDFQKVLEKSFGYLAVRQEGALAGFVNIAWDGGQHGFILDTTVHPNHQRDGIGSALLAEAVRVAQEGNLEWLHVDYLPEHEEFYRKAGFRGTAAGLMRI